MAAAVVALARSRNLFAVIVLGGIYSFLMATVLVALDAVDVAMTEASVGAGMSTVLLLAALYLCKGEEAKPVRKPWLSLAAATMVGARARLRHARPAGVLRSQAPIHMHVAPRYLNDALKETGVPNVVTAVLASYRGYDTLGETTVVFTAGAGVIALLRRRRRDAREGGRRVRHDLILRVIAKILIPFILLFAALRPVPRRLRPRRRLPGRGDRRGGDHLPRDHLRPGDHAQASCPARWWRRCSPPAC